MIIFFFALLSCSRSAEQDKLVALTRKIQNIEAKASELKDAYSSTDNSVDLLFDCPIVSKRIEGDPVIYILQSNLISIKTEILNNKKNQVLLHKILRPKVEV
jgi:hypothetical protein